jgi:putative Mg2+ transporter-C (MgtC) family protein
MKIMNTILVRILASLLAGFLLGLERQIHRQPAGLKTHILICTGSTLLMIVSMLLSGTLSVMNGATPRFGDPARLAAQVVSGIGFLGGGAIIRQGFNIKGLTTAATIWVSAAIGLAIGMGAYFAAGVTLAAVLFTLILMEKFETRFFPAKNIKTLYLVFEEKYFNYDALVHELAGMKIAVGNMDVSKTVASDRIKLSLQVHIPAKIDLDLLTETLKRIGTLVKMELTSNEKSPR